MSLFRGKNILKKFFKMNNKEQDNYNNATLDLIKKFVDYNQRKRINSLTQIESEVENIYKIGPKLFDIFDCDGDDWLLVGFYKF